MQKKKGFVSIVGAGPGDPKLLTLRAKEVLEEADAVVYDYLVHPKILRHAEHAEQIYVGKKGGDPDSTPQKSIESLLVKLAREGKRVVRLKGGDPFVFGRGGEEALWLARHRVPFEISPGITAGIAAPAYAGIPVTHRKLASEVTLITAHEDPSKKGSDLNWNALAKLKGTLVLYMGVKALPQVVDLLIRYGRKRKTPVSVIRWGTTGEQRTVTGTLATIVQKVEEAKLQAPAITVIGEVNRLRRKLAWFSAEGRIRPNSGGEEKPLFGKTILVTRSRKQASELADELENLGARVLELPTIEVSPIRDFHSLDRAVKNIRKYYWLVFTSENGVEAFFKRFRELGKDTRTLSSLKIAAVGPGTKAKLNAFSIEPDLVPKVFTTEGLVRAFQGLKIARKKFLLLRTNIAPDFLNRSLKKLGAQVTEISVYRTEKPAGLEHRVAELVRQYPIDYVTFTSSSTAQHFFEALKNGRHIEAKVISIGPVTSKTILAFGAKVDREAKVSTIPGLIEAVLKEARS
ncbi:MAG: uroporphyrinogen-III C-methyltransferase [Candidatus Omnitrophica bacterium]|nr:uroporphyrinogen-III C-methyltransferase [Candidatus Omnitrophota bacterium]